MRQSNSSSVSMTTTSVAARTSVASAFPHRRRLRRFPNYHACEAMRPTVEDGVPSMILADYEAKREGTSGSAAGTKRPMRTRPDRYPRPGRRTLNIGGGGHDGERHVGSYESGRPRAEPSASLNGAISSGPDRNSNQQQSANALTASAQRRDFELVRLLVVHARAACFGARPRERKRRQAEGVLGCLKTEKMEKTSLYL